VSMLNLVRFNGKKSLLPYIMIFSYFIFLLWQVNSFIQSADRLYAVDVASYLLTSEAFLNQNIRNANFLYSFPVFPLMLVILELLPLSNYITYLFVLYLGLVLLSIIWIVFTYLLVKLLNGRYPIQISFLILLLLSFRPFLEQYAWGGYSQFLSDIFGLLALISTYTMLSKGLNSNSFTFSNLLKISCLLVLSFSSEAYSGIFWLITVTLYIFLFSKKLQIKKLMLFEASLILIVLLGSLIIFSFAGPFLGIDYFGSRMYIVPNALYLPNIITTFGEFMFGYASVFSFKWILSVSLLFAVIFSLSFRYLKTKKSKSSFNMNLSHLATSLWISLFIIFLLTPAYYADRFIHFLVFPLTIELLNATIRLNQLSKVGIKSRVTKLLLFLLVITIFLSSTFNIPEYLMYYSFPSDYIAATDKIELKPYGSLVYGVQPFVASFISKNSVYPVFQPVWFTRKQQVDSSIIGRLIYEGYYIINLSHTYVTLDKQGARVSVYKFIKPYFLNVLTIPPLLIEFDSGSELQVSEGQINPKEIQIKSNGIKLLYQIGDDIYYEKFISVDQEHIQITYSFNFPIKRIVISSLYSDAITNRKFEQTASNMLLVESEIEYKEPWFLVTAQINLALSTVNADISIVEDAGLIEIVPIYSNISMSKSVTISFVIPIEELRYSRAPPSIITAADLIEEYNIKYLIVSVDDSSRLPPHINKVMLYQHGRLLIYKLS